MTLCWLLYCGSKGDHQRCSTLSTFLWFEVVEQLADGRWEWVAMVSPFQVLGMQMKDDGADERVGIVEAAADTASTAFGQTLGPLIYSLRFSHP